MAQDGGTVVRLTHQPLLHQEVLLVLICVRGWVDPTEGFYVNEKFPMTPAGIFLLTFIHVVNNYRCGAYNWVCDPML